MTNVHAPAANAAARSARAGSIEMIASVALVAAALRYWLWYFNRGTNLLDEGSQAAQAVRILHGDLIYRDFATVVAPGSYYTVAWLFRLFGPQLLVIRWTALAIGIGILVTTLGIARRLVSWPFAASAALLTTVWGWFLVTPNLYSWQSMFFALLALLCYLRAARDGGPRWMFVAGAMAGAAVLVKQNTGLFASLALVLTIWLSRPFDVMRIKARTRLRATGHFVGGAALVVVPVVAALLLSGARPFLYQEWVYYPGTVYPARLTLPYPSFYPVLSDPGFGTLRTAVPAMLGGRLPEAAVAALWVKFALFLPFLVFPLALASLAIVTVRWRRTHVAAHAWEGHTLLAVILFAALTFLQVFPRADATHILFGMQPVFVLLAYLCFCIWRAAAAAVSRLGSVTWVKAISAALVVVTLVPELALLWYGYKRTDFEYLNYIEPLQSTRARGIWAHPEEAARVDPVTRYIEQHTAPGEPIFVVPWAAGFYFLADRPNPTRYDLFLYRDDRIYPCVVASLDRTAPSYVVYGYVWDVDERKFRDYAKPLDDYIRSRYRIEATFPGYEIWRRIDGLVPASARRSTECAPVRFRFGLGRLAGD